MICKIHVSQNGNDICESAKEMEEWKHRRFSSNENDMYNFQKFVNVPTFQSDGHVSALHGRTFKSGGRVGALRRTQNPSLERQYAPQLCINRII